MLFLIPGVGAMVATALMLNAVLPLKGRLANLLGLACLSYAQVVLLAEALSELRLIGRWGFLVGHLVLLVLALTLWWRRGRPDRAPCCADKYGTIMNGRRAHFQRGFPRSSQRRASVRRYRAASSHRREPSNGPRPTAPAAITGTGARPLPSIIPQTTR